MMFRCIPLFPSGALCSRINGKCIGSDVDKKMEYRVSHWVDKFPDFPTDWAMGWVVGVVSPRVVVRLASVVLRCRSLASGRRWPLRAVVLLPLAAGLGPLSPPLLVSFVRLFLLLCWSLMSGVAFLLPVLSLVIFLFFLLTCAHGSGILSGVVSLLALVAGCSVAAVGLFCGLAVSRSPAACARAERRLLGSGAARFARLPGPLAAAAAARLAALAAVVPSRLPVPPAPSLGGWLS